MINFDSKRYMERVELSEVESNFDAYCARMDREDIGFILVKDGVDKYLLRPYHWDRPEVEAILVEIETELYDQISEFIAPMNISHEELIDAFFRWCTDPDTQGTAMDWLQTATKARHYHNDARKETL